MTPDIPIEWLIDSDPTLRWQVERDLLHAPEHIWTATRARIPHEGHGARLLALQDPDGQWAGGAFFPADHDPHNPDNPGQPWTATTWTLNTLREWGLDPAVLQKNHTAERLAEHSRWEYQNLPYWGGEVDCCINGWTLANGAWLGADVTAIADWFVEHQLPDGGWNCEWINGATRSSYHSTLNALKGLLAHEIATGGTTATRAARHTGEQYLLRRNLFRRLSTGQPVADWTTNLIHPPRWTYNILNAADHFRTAALHDHTPPDPRMTDAIELIRTARHPDGTWHQGKPHPGTVWFPTDPPQNQPSPWLTFHATRLLTWWDTAHEPTR
ncbi:squalene cyclase [Nocardia aurantia]|uniref:Squalene cyclase n=1 Tax=Nocardia aurantia TaxID=2585199 RepID=A0A7K0DY35_9NOCA|nr:squalene cyclase [Nocardia aurantia]MQY30458.1 hypothetical protein [Nocardia aurantia]